MAYVHWVWTWHLCSFFGYHEKCYFSFIMGYTEKNLRSPSDVIVDVITMKILFSCTIWGHLFISDVKLKLCLTFWHFQNGRHFEVATNFFTGSDTRMWICYKDSHEHLWHFELLIDIAVQRYDLFWDLMTSSVKQSTIVCKGVLTIQWYICTLSLKVISLFVLQL